MAGDVTIQGDRLVLRALRPAEVDEEWLAMTPRMLHAIALRNLQLTRESELMLAKLCAHTVNGGFHAPQTPTQPQSYMNHPYPEQAARPVFGEDIMGAFAGSSKRVN